VLQRSSLPEVFPHPGLAGISSHHQNNYGLDTYKLKLENKPMNMSTTNNNESRNSLPSPFTTESLALQGGEEVSDFKIYDQIF
jgi:hypothetical protein